MTTPKVSTFSRYGDRWYAVDDDRKAVGVSGVVNMLPKDALPRWAAREAAEFTVKNIKAVYELSGVDPAAAIALIKGAPWRKSGSAADKGTEAHHYTENVARAVMAGEKPTGSVPKDIFPYLKQYARFLREFDVQPVMVETTVYHDEPRQDYAGTFDLMARLQTLSGDLAIVDTKTGASGVYSSSAIQQTGYRYARQYVDSETGELGLMPEIGATYALWLRPEGYALIPLESTQAELDAWRHLRAMYQWKVEREKKVVGKAINAVPLKKQWKPR
jgi:hypothetical protein